MMLRILSMMLMLQTYTGNSRHAYWISWDDKIYLSSTRTRYTKSSVVHFDNGIRIKIYT